MGDFKLGNRISFFTWANSSSIDFNPDSIDTAAKRKIRELDQGAKGSDLDIVNELMDKKRKKFKASEPLKLERAKKLKNNSIVSIESAKSPISNYDDQEEEWSDCDELEMSRNISIIESKITKKLPVDSSREGASDMVTPQDSDIASNFSHDSDNQDNDDEVQWSDCDDEITRNLSLIEQNISSTTSKLDRSALQEISNLSREDQQ